MVFVISLLEYIRTVFAYRINFWYDSRKVVTVIKKMYEIEL